jgi:hypothetical protein
VIERAAPGVVALARMASRPGFEVRLAERSFPVRYHDDLRRAVEEALSRLPAEPNIPASPASTAFTAPQVRLPGLLRRLVGAIQRLFNA